MFDAPEGQRAAATKLWPVFMFTSVEVIVVPTVTSVFASEAHGFLGAIASLALVAVLNAH